MVGLVILLFIFYMCLKFSIIKTFRNNIVSMSSSPWLIISALKMKCTLLVFTCMGVDMQKACYKNQMLFECFSFPICKMG